MFTRSKTAQNTKTKTKNMTTTTTTTTATSPVMSLLPSAPTLSTLGLNRTMTHEEQSSFMEIPLKELRTMIQPYDGRPEETISFIRTCDRIILQAAETTRRKIILGHILSNLKGEASALANAHAGEKWTPLRTAIIKNFLTQDGEENIRSQLTLIKQENRETVNEFTRRVNRLHTSLIGYAELGTDETEKARKIAEIDKVTLENYIIGLKGSIGTFVRAKSPTTLDDAIESARKEEKSLERFRDDKTGSQQRNQQKNDNIRNNYPRNSNGMQQKNSNITCYFCKKNGHREAECYAKRRDAEQRTRTTNRVTCTFCKRNGHEEKNCYFKKRNDKYCSFCKINGHNRDECRRSQPRNANHLNESGADSTQSGIRDTCHTDVGIAQQ
jgi:hypothetical protein